MRSNFNAFNTLDAVQFLHGCMRVVPPLQYVTVYWHHSDDAHTVRFLCRVGQKNRGHSVI